MNSVVYLACAATSIFCAMLLVRSYRKTGHRLLYWSSWCFAGLAINNLLLFIDLVLVPSISLFEWRSAVALLGILALAFGLVQETR
jgi:hypothetical protein